MRWRALLLILSMVAPAAPAGAAVRAVVVGASAFTDAALARYALPGAARDAERMTASLRTLGVPPDAIATLTGAGATLAAIREALDALEARSSAGDRAVIFLSGHGTQAPARTDDPLEPDGLDELFLTADAGRWNARSGMLPGALTDDEIGSRVGALRARGVDVWVVIDSCTGGGLLRGRRVAKAVPPSQFGIPDRSPVRGAVDASGFVDGGLAGGGRLVAFAAAGPGAIAWDDGEGGVFTRILANAIALDPPASYAALAAAAGQGGAGPIWTTGDLSAPLLFAGRSPDLLELARELPALPFPTLLSVDRAGACRSDEPPHAARKNRASDAVTLLRHCDHVRVDLAEPAEALRVEAWYRDAAGGYTSLAPPLGLIVAPGRWANVGFTFVTRDPASGRPLPQGEEMLVLIARDARGTPRGARLLRFRADS